MFARLPLYGPSDSSGAAPAGTPAPAPTPAPSPAPSGGAPAPSPAPAKGDDTAAMLKAVLARLDAVEAQSTKKDADLAAASDAKTQAEKAKQTLEERLASVEAARAQDKISAEFERLLGKYSFTDDAARSQAMKLFKADYALELKEEAVLARGPDKKPLHLAHAWDAFAKGEGQRFIAAKAQPGPGAPEAAPAQTPGGKRPKDMTREEFDRAWKTGKMPDGTPIEGRLVPNGPVMKFADRQNPAGRAGEIRAAFGELAKRLPPGR